MFNFLMVISKSKATIYYFLEGTEILTGEAFVWEIDSERECKQYCHTMMKYLFGITKSALTFEKLFFAHAFVVIFD